MPRKAFGKASGFGRSGHIGFGGFGTQSLMGGQGGTGSAAENVKVNPMYSQEGQQFQDFASDQGAPLSQQEVGQPFQDDRSRFLGFGWKMGHNNAADLNLGLDVNRISGQQQNDQNLSYQRALLKLTTDEDIRALTAKVPLEIQQALGTALATTGREVNPYNVGITTDAANAKDLLATQGARQQREIGGLTHPSNVIANVADAERKMNEANSLNEESGTIAGINAAKLGYRGQLMLPAAQSNKLYSQQLNTGDVAYNPQADLTGGYPFVTGSTHKQTLTQDPDVMGIPGSGKSHLTTETVMPQRPLTAAKIAAAKAQLGQPAGVTQQQIAPNPLASQPQGPMPAPMQQAPTPKPSLYSQAEDTLGGYFKPTTKKTQVGNRTGQEIDKGDSAVLKQLTDWLGSAKGESSAGGRTVNQGMNAKILKVKKLLESYYE